LTDIFGHLGCHLRRRILSLGQKAKMGPKRIPLRVPLARKHTGTSKSDERKYDNAAPQQTHDHRRHGGCIHRLLAASFFLRPLTIIIRITKVGFIVNIDFLLWG